MIDHLFQKVTQPLFFLFGNYQRVVRLIGTAFCGVIFCICISSCSDAKTVLTFWVMGSEGEFVSQLLPEFERTHPGIKVKLEQLPWSAAHEKLLTAYAGDALPDMAQIGNSWIPEMGALNALEALTPYAEKSDTVKLDDFFNGILETNRLGSELFGVPWYIDTRLLFYRRDLLEQAGYDHPPATWDEWRKMFAAISKKWDGARMGILLPVNEFEPLLALSLQQPGELLRDDARYANFSGPGFSSSLAFYTEIFSKGYARNLSNNQISNVWDEFAKGSFVFYISGPWNVGEFKRRMPAHLKDAWSTAALPGPNGPSASTAGGASMVIFNNAKHKKEAWALIEYLSRTDIQLRFHELTGNMPPRRSIWQDTSLAKDIHAKAFRDQLDRVKAAPKVPQWERIVNEMQLTASKIVFAQEKNLKFDVKDYQNELDATVDGWLEKRRWMLEQHVVQKP
ncbi:MAG: sugar ABC transporter substrate-binding protein [Pseudomonadota bacterium]